LKRANSLAELSHGLSYDVVATMKECFTQMDSNGDGELSKAELAQVMRSLGIKHSDQEIDSLFNDLDADKSNSISFQEFLGGLRWSSRSNNIGDKNKMSKFLRGIDPKQIEEMKLVFTELDTNGDGSITADELFIMMQKLKLDASPEEFAELFHSLDLNADGKIELEEFLSGMRWLSKGLTISSKLEQPSHVGKNAGALSEDKKKILSLQERNDVLMNYLKDIINRGMTIAEDNYKNKEYAVTKAVLDTLDWDTLEGMELFVGTLTTPKQKDHQTKMRTRLKKAHE